MVVFCDQIYAGERFSSFEAYVFVDKALVRSNPDTSSQAIDTLYVGHKLTVLDMVGTTYSLNGLNNYWYKIGYFSGNKLKTGYIWASLISLKHIPIKDNIIMFGVYSYNKDSGYLLGIKNISDNRIVSKVSFTLKCPNVENGSGFPDFSLKFFDNLGFKAFDNIIKVSFAGLPDYEDHERIILGIINNELFYVANEFSQGEGGIGSSCRYYIFPNEKGGQPDCIIYIVKEYKFSESKNRDVLIVNTSERFVWENNALKKIVQ
jgi:hypothetical protein